MSISPPEVNPLMSQLYRNFVAGERAYRGIAYRLAAALVPSVRENERSIYLDRGTGVFSRDTFPEIVDRQLHKLRRGYVRGVTLIEADMDKLKEINDTMGHDEGDVAIKLLADALLKSVRVTEPPQDVPSFYRMLHYLMPPEITEITETAEPEKRRLNSHLDYVARWGGDEFGIVSGADIDERDAATMAAWVPRRVEAAGEGTESGHKIVSSTGGAFTDRPMALREFIKRADDTMYRVKRSGDGANLSALWTPDGRTAFYTLEPDPESGSQNLRIDRLEAGAPLANSY